MHKTGNLRKFGQSPSCPDKSAGRLANKSLVCLAVLGALLAQGGSHAAPDQVQSVPVTNVGQAIERAINTQPEVQARWDAFLASGHDRRAAKGGYLPSVDFQGEIGAANRDHDGRGWFGRDYAELSITQMLFDGFLVRNQLKEADQHRLARYYELLDEVQNKALEAILTYEDVRQYRESVALARQNYDAHKSVLALIEERTGSGVSNKADLQQASGRLALAQANLLTEEANLHDVTAHFERVVGARPAETLEAHAPAADRLPTDMTVLMSEAVRNHPSLFAANATVQAAEAFIRQSKAAYYPKVNAVGRVGTYRNTSGFDAQYDREGRGQEGFVGLSMSYNLYRGGADKARANAATSRMHQSQDLLRKACVDLRQTASIAWNDVANLRSKIAALDAHRVSAREVVEAYEKQFYIGRRTLLDVLDARNEAFQAQRSFVQAQHELNKAYYRTLHAMGVLMDVLGQARADVPAIDALNGESGQAGQIDCGGVLAIQS